MANKTFHGSCQCGRIKFEATFDLAAGTTKCNCNACWKRRTWSARCTPENFRGLAGEDQFSDAQPGQTKGQHGFCKGCGVRPYGWVPKSDWNEAEYVSINVACLDDLAPADLVAAPVQYCDGRANNWWNAPAEIRHL
jgi:hypothetical protein